MSRARLRVYPPVVYGLGLLVALVGHLLLPLSLPHLWWLRAIGALLIAASMALAAWTAATFTRARTTVHPFHEASTLVTDGPFRFSRNPIYLGFTTATIGVALTAASWWPVFVLPVIGWVMEGIIVWEERMLSRVFGPAYEAFSRRTRRWI